MKILKEVVKSILFRLKPSHFILTLLAGIGLVIFLFVRWLSSVTFTSSPLFIIIILSFFFLLSRLSVLSSVGIGFLPFIMFGMMLKYGSIPNLAMIWSTTFIYCWIAQRSTPIDFAITKSVSNSLAQGIYLSLWTLTMIIFLKIVSMDYILANLMYVYMVTVGIYIVFMIICLITLACRPIPEVLIQNAMVMIPIQYFIFKFLGVGFLKYLQIIT